MPDYPQSRTDYIEWFFSPDDVVERIEAPDGAVITVQRYLDGHSWICHPCKAVGTDGEWTEYSDHMYANMRRQAPGAGKRWQAEHGARWHAIGQHGADESIDDEEG